MLNTIPTCLSQGLEEGTIRFDPALPIHSIYIPYPWFILSCTAAMNWVSSFAVKWHAEWMILWREWQRNRFNQGSRTGQANRSHR